jgi:hypothetical protein
LFDSNLIEHNFLQIAARNLFFEKRFHEFKFSDDVSHDMFGCLGLLQFDDLAEGHLRLHHLFYDIDGLLQFG